jgi:hypothetical protein
LAIAAVWVRVPLRLHNKPLNDLDARFLRGLLYMFTCKSLAKASDLHVNVIYLATTMEAGVAQP